MVDPWEDPRIDPVVDAPTAGPIGQPPGYQGLEYWAQYGTDPSVIFDENGQLRPGWARTANGYEMVGGNAAAAAPINTGAPAPVAGGGGGGGFNWSPGAVPDFNAPRWQAPPEFKYGKTFAAPTREELTNDPSFQFRLDQGRKALEQSAAGKGILRTGGTLKDLVNYGQNFATNEYGNVYNRKFNEYKFDYDKEADIYSKNYNLARDVFDRNYKAAYDEYSPKLRGWETNTNIAARQQEALFNRDWQKYLADRNFEQEDVNLFPVTS